MRSQTTRILLTSVIAAVLVSMFQAVLTLAAPVILPHTFVSGQSLPASWLNDNFGALASGINSIDTNQIALNAVATQSIAAGAVTTVKLADAPNGVSASKINAGATVQSQATQVVTPSLSFQLTETTFAQTAPLTTRGGTVVISGVIVLKLQGSYAPGNTITIRVYRGTTLLDTYLWDPVAVTSEIVPVAFNDAPGAVTTTYKVTGQSSSGGLVVSTPASGAGRLTVTEHS